MFASWRGIRRRDAAHSYATRTLVNTHLAGKRTKRSTEILTSQVPDYPATGVPAETQMLVRAALASLPRQCRAVVMLRYWADLSVDQVAEMLGCSPGTVKSQSARGPDKLRQTLADPVEPSPATGRNHERHETTDPGHG